MSIVIKIVHSLCKLKSHTSKNTWAAQIGLDGWEKKEHKVKCVGKGWVWSKHIVRKWEWNNTSSWKQGGTGDCNGGWSNPEWKRQILNTFFHAE